MLSLAIGSLYVQAFGARPKRAKGREVYIGAYLTPQLAAHAYGKAAIKKRGKAANTNVGAHPLAWACLSLACIS